MKRSYEFSVAVNVGLLEVTQAECFNATQVPEKKWWS
jgi:hypothetical protein